MSPALLTTQLPLPLVRRGKVRDVYAVGADRLLLVTTDRISAFDVVMHEAIPFKGAVLTQLTAWWLDQLNTRVAHHLLTADTNEIIRRVPELAAYRDQLAGRTMLCVAADVVPIECVVRGYITGSAWKEYRQSGTLAGERLASGLRESDRLDPPLFSPATKAETGHDENITIAQVVSSLGAETTATLERLARTIYEFGRATAEPKGIIVADTKFEFGWRDGQLLLIDEVLTPDSSRFWPAADYAPGRGQPSFDKQPLRDWLDRERQAGRWNGEAPPPTLPPEIIRATSLRYRDAFHRLTGSPLDVSGLGLPEDPS
ncbi:MAG: phosphoribosylaminoimidazolesuccinocarboxamide synthase [Gemmatimonadaceae bacterium]|nr:phosphoribosylaminoimidazolesuccinocarboxamide synthase [Gemmatimonadaceae bacterium]